MLGKKNQVVPDSARREKGYEGHWTESSCQECFWGKVII